MMKSLGNILQNKASRSPLLRSVAASLVVEEANRILFGLFGDAAARYAQAAYLKQNTLSVACLSSVMAQEIKLHEKDIVKALNKKAGYEAVIKIIYLA